MTDPVASPCLSPQFDMTDLACPAFWRGEAAGVVGACMRISEALDGRDAESATSGSPELNALRRRLRLLREERGLLREVLRQLCSLQGYLHVHGMLGPEVVELLDRAWKAGLAAGGAAPEGAIE